MKSRVLLLSAIVAATAGLSAGAAQASQPDAQAQAAALLSSSYVASPASASNASTQAVQGDAHAQAAALLSGTRTSPSADAVQAPSRAERLSLDAQAHAATLLSGSRSTVQEIARTTATTQQLGDHPAVIAARTWSTRGVDPNTFLVAHPARLELVAASPSVKQDTDVQATASTQVLGAAGR